MFLTAYEKEKETNNETELLCPWGVGCRTPFLNLNKTLHLLHLCITFSLKIFKTVYSAVNNLISSFTLMFLALFLHIYLKNGILFEEGSESFLISS